MKIAAEGSPKGKGRIALHLVLAAASLIPMSAFADSTTGTTVTVSGTPTPGKQVSAHVVVTGKHLVTGPGFTVTGGKVQVTVNGTLVAQVEAAWPFNSNLSDSGCVQYDQYGSCIRTKYISTNTDVTLPVSLPAGATSYSIVASYTGDLDSHSSTSAPVVLTPVYPDVSAATSLLLND
ncbi:MAG TPA: hypothetical protein VGN46_17275 [Luteibacter sp.]|uniref:hypothetical protein n=1 Tax=Luteibacter sp. TaxID=1886636 RepID=UPI002F3F4724